MKLKSAQKVHYDAGPNMTPLVDIVMVILIFLMLTGSFVVNEIFLRNNVALVKKGQSANVAPNVPLDEPLEIRVDSEGSENWVAQAGGYQVRNSREKLAALLTNMRKELNASGTTTEKIQVVLSPGRNTKYKHLVEVQQAALEAKLVKIAFSQAH